MTRARSVRHRTLSSPVTTNPLLPLDRGRALAEPALRWLRGLTPQRLHKAPWKGTCALHKGQSSVAIEITVLHYSAAMLFNCRMRTGGFASCACRRCAEAKGRGTPSRELCHVRPASFAVETAGICRKRSIRAASPSRDPSDGPPRPRPAARRQGVRAGGASLPAHRGDAAERRAPRQSDRRSHLADFLSSRRCRRKAGAGGRGAADAGGGRGRLSADAAVRPLSGPAWYRRRRDDAALPSAPAAAARFPPRAFRLRRPEP